MTSADNLTSLLEHGNGECLELKERVEVELVVRSVAAMLNSAGGAVVVGVRDDGTLVGITKVHESRRKLEEALSTSVSPRPAFSIRTVPVSKRRHLLVIDVPIGTEGPYVSGQHILVRRGGEDVEVKPHEVIGLILKQTDARLRWERHPALGATLEDLDLDEVKRTASLAAELRYEQLGNSPGDILERLHLLQSGQVTNGAVVLFGRRPVTRLPQTRIRMARFMSEANDDLADNRVGEGNLFVLLDAVDAFLKKHLRIQSKLPEQGYKRTDRPALPAKALREAILNALAHRDYAAYHGGIRIGIWDDRVEVWNSGSLPSEITVGDLKRRHASLPRNPDIANVLFLRGLVEGWGIGTGMIVEQFDMNGLPEPQWYVESGGLRLLLPTRESGAPVDLLPRQRKFIAELGDGASARTAEYETAIGQKVTSRQARNDLQQLVEAGFLRREGKGRSTRYIRTAKPAP